LEKSRSDPHWRAAFLKSLGEIRAAQGRTAEAERFFSQTVAVCEHYAGGCFRWDWGSAACQLGMLYAGQGRKREARVWAVRVGNLYQGLAVNYESIWYFMQLAGLYINLGVSDKAEALLRQILATHGSALTDEAMAETESILAKLYKAQGRLAEAEELYVKAIAAFKIHGDKGEAIGALKGLAATYEKEGKGLEAAAARREAAILGAHGGKS
jgi:tetratricopeptide (TPR) repeat protein